MRENIIIFSNANGYGGAEKSIEAIIKEMAKSCKITVFATNKTHLKNLSKISDIELIELEYGNGIVATYKNLVKIKPYINLYNNILINTNKGAFYLSLLSYMLNLKSKNICIFIRDFQWKYQKFIFKSLKKYNPLYLFTSHAFFDYESFFSKNIKHFEIVPNFFESRIVDQQFNKHPNKKTILIPAMINRWKGIEYAIKAISKVDDDNLELKIVGKVVDQEYFEELNQLINKLSLKNVEFIPYTDNIKSFYDESYIVLNTSISEFGGPETFGRTILEAWAYKKPVVSFNCGGPKYLIDNGVDGILVPEGNVELLSNAIVELLKNENLYADLVKNAHKKLNEIYNKNKIVTIMKKICCDKD